MVKDNFVQAFLETRLTALHNSSAPSVTNYKQKVISFIIAALLISILPILHIGKNKKYLMELKLNSFNDESIYFM